ncbi:MAG: glycosyltransferase family 2 protein [Candidatus Brocadiales bacterium]
MYGTKSVCVIIPAYNEEATIGKVIDSLEDFVDSVIVVDDGSTDKTAEIARARSKNRCLIVESHAENKGLGLAFKTGITKALESDTDILVNIDADGQFNPKDIAKLIEPIITGKADFVTASRFCDSSHYPDMPKIKFLGNKLMSSLVSSIIGKTFYDVSCGFRAYSRETALKLNLFGTYTYTQETFIYLAFKGASIVEVPVLVKGKREIGESKVASNLFKYGYQTTKFILRIFRDYEAFKLFSIVALMTFTLGAALASFVLIHFLSAGSFTPYKFVAFIAGFLFFLSMFFLLLGFILQKILHTSLQ